MATDFRVRTNWRHHRKRTRLIREKGEKGVLFIEDLWSFAAEMHTDGVLRGMTAQDMADEVGYSEDAEGMLGTCVAQRLIDPPDSNCPHFRLHDWRDHQAYIVHAEARSASARFAALEKHRKNKTLLRTACAADAPSPDPDPSPDPTPVPDPKPTPLVRAARSRPREVDPSFQQFWDAYPRKNGKGKAEDSWRKIHPDEALTQKILASVDAHKKCDQWVKDGGQFIPHPATFLNQRRWEDETKIVKQDPNAGKKFHDWDFFENQPARLWVDLSDGKRQFSTDSQRDQLNRCREAHPEWF